MEAAEDLLSGSPEAIRSFLAVVIPDLQRDLLAGYLESCREPAPGFRWVKPENLHLTLRFLGGVENGRLMAFAGTLRTVALVPFELSLGSLGTFGRGRAVRVVWLGPEIGSEPLLRLAGEVEARCADNGFPPLDRPFHPHLTLARSRSRRGDALPSLPAPPDLPPWTVTGFRLYRSRLGPGGPAYSVLAEFGPGAAILGRWS